MTGSFNYLWPTAAAWGLLLLFSQSPTQPRWLLVGLPAALVAGSHEQVGVVLLTLTLCTGLFYMKNLFSVENIDKAVLSIIAWFVYIVLLWGHYHEGWRGRRVVWFNVAGAGILTLAYFGSRFIQQFAG